MSADAACALLHAQRAASAFDGVHDFLDRVLDQGNPPLTREEMGHQVRVLGGCMWPLISEVLQRTRGRPDWALVEQIGLAARLHAEKASLEFTPSLGFVRRLALLILNLLERVEPDLASSADARRSCPDHLDPRTTALENV
ncbi:DUF6415 family natural product biosynthesis protein [Streptomyces longispororuber]|uniref:DUF6415 family natural product biosynthesis protein n=1 Tax=Streptomyces longispororuber TaxID=68230 RepID=UPI0033CFAA79